MQKLFAPPMCLSALPPPIFVDRICTCTRVRTSFEQGRILGHENLGEVVEIGSGVERVKVGDYVCLPFNVGCGFARIVKKV